MPSVIRPFDTASTLIAALALTAAALVTELPTAVASPMRSVVVAAMANATNASPLTFWESTTQRPSQPAASTSLPVLALRLGEALVCNHISITDTLVSKLGPALVPAVRRLCGAVDTPVSMRPSALRYL